MPVGLGGPDADAVGLACDLLGHKKGDLYIVYAIEVDRSLPVDAEIGDDFAKGEELLKRMEEVSKPYGCRTQADILQSRRAGLAAVQEAFDKKVDAIVARLHSNCGWLGQRTVGFDFRPIGVR